MTHNEFIKRLSFFWVAQDGERILELVGRYLTENKSDLLKDHNHKFFGRKELSSLLDWKYMLEIIKDKMIKSMLKKHNFS